jgi:hypothetical protein
MGRLLDTAAEHRSTVDEIAMTSAASVAREWSRADPARLESEWTARAPQLAAAVSSAQLEAAQQATGYIASTVGGTAALAAQSFSGVTREGREIAPELYSVGVGAAFQAGTALMSILAANTIRDAGRSADNTLAVANGALYSVRVVSPGACSRCAILAGVKGYRTDFERHPECRCFSMPLRDNETPEGFFQHPSDYFESMTEVEQDRVFTKSGAWAIRNGADPIKVVNARRGAYKTSTLRADGSYSRSRLRPVTIGVRPDGSPLQVYATLEGTTARGAWGRGRSELVKVGDERYRRSNTLRLMPESVMKMTTSESPERIRELLKRYGYII